jgi:hypothetical protein
MPDQKSKVFALPFTIWRLENNYLWVCNHRT